MGETLLSVNVNKLATLRNSRGGNNPNVVEKALEIVELGAQGITVHPRPDERHIRKKDVYEISEKLEKVEFNIEGYPSEDFLKLIKEVKPAQCTLVPDPPEVLTSNAGWKISENKDFLKNVVEDLHSSGCRVSLFFDPYDHQKEELQIAKEFVGADRIELYTEMYASAFHKENRESVTEVYAKAALAAKELGLGVNAGHDLDLHNLKYFVEQVPHVLEVSIGHALVCDALDFGFKETIKKYLNCLQN